MPIYETTKADWKLFQALLPQWQERYMCRLCDEYAVNLTRSKRGSDAFWEIEKRIQYPVWWLRLCHSPGVCPPVRPGGRISHSRPQPQHLEPRGRRCSRHLRNLGEEG